MTVQIPKLSWWQVRSERKRLDQLRSQIGVKVFVGAYSSDTVDMEELLTGSIGDHVASYLKCVGVSASQFDGSIYLTDPYWFVAPIQSLNLGGRWQDWTISFEGRGELPIFTIFRLATADGSVVINRLLKKMHWPTTELPGNLLALKGELVEIEYVVKGRVRTIKGTVVNIRPFEEIELKGNIHIPFVGKNIAIRKIITEKTLDNQDKWISEWYKAGEQINESLVPQDRWVAEELVKWICFAPGNYPVGCGYRVSKRGIGVFS
ncbi:MAG: hypothetical protein WC242_00545 [Candidatus Paceibacterota bacterium]|jgi:hypothetical protein